MLQKVATRSHELLGHQAHLRLAKRFKSSSARSPRYHPKVRALPFALSPQEAVEKIVLPKHIKYMIMYNNLYYNYHLRQPWTIDWKTPVTFTHKEITPIYLPSWFVDLDIALTPIFGPGNSSSETILTQAFFPGHDKDPLYRMPLRSVETPELLSQAVPFSSDMSKQHGVDIVCMSYSSSPLLIRDAARDMMRAQIHRCVLAAYPVLIPVYLVKYLFNTLVGPIETFALVEAASREGGTVYFKHISDDIYDKHAQMKLGGAVERIYRRRYLNRYEFEVTPRDGNRFIGPSQVHTGTQFMRKLDALLSSTSKDNPLVIYKQYEKVHRKNSPINFDDARIRPWIAKELKDMRLYLWARTAVLKLPMQADIEKGRLENPQEESDDPMDIVKPDWLLQWEKQEIARRNKNKSKK